MSCKYAFAAAIIAATTSIVSAAPAPAAQTLVTPPAGQPTCLLRAVTATGPAPQHSSALEKIPGAMHEFHTSISSSVFHMQQVRTVSVPLGCLPFYLRRFPFSQPGGACRLTSVRHSPWRAGFDGVGEETETVAAKSAALISYRIFRPNPDRVSDVLILMRLPPR
jgi:hypothetical protein